MVLKVHPGLRPTLLVQLLVRGLLGGPSGSCSCRTRTRRGNASERERERPPCMSCYTLVLWALAATMALTMCCRTS